MDENPSDGLADCPELGVLPTIRFGAGHLLFDERTASLGYPLVRRGSIRVFKAFANGRELLLYRVAPGETCVVSAACLFTGARYTARAVAEGDVELQLIPPALFNELMDRRGFRRFVMGQFTHRLADLMALVDAVFSHRLDQRLAARLLAMRHDHGDVLSVTHQQLADELGSIREVVSRLLKQFEAQGWLALERGSIRIVAPHSIEALAHEPG